MDKTIKILLPIVAVVIAFAFQSCISDDIEPEVQRTEQTELEELNSALTNLESQGYDIDTTELGIYYVVHVEGEGPTATEGDTCQLEYAGYFFDGTVFDASQDHYINGIWEFIFKEVDLIPGFDDGIALMQKGSEIDIIVPSRHAYGAAGSYTIPPYQPLLFSLKMHDLKPSSE